MATPFVSDQGSRNVRHVEVSHQGQPNFNLPRPASNKSVVGFDCEFVERPPKAFQVHCPVCLLVVRDPHQVTCCGYSFCQPCIDIIERGKKPCPTCNKIQYSVFPNKGLQRAINEYQILCGHQKLGCQWVGELRELDEHLNENPMLGRQFVGCEFAEVECNDCGKPFQRQYFKAHQLEQHPFSCEYCHEYESYHHDVVKNHWPVCGFRPVPCPNECGVYPERQNLEHHVSNECSLIEVNCDFHYAGCEVQLRRRDMPGHLADKLVHHMAQLAAYNRKKVQEKDQQIMQLTEDLKQEMDKNCQKIDRLERDNGALKQEIAQLQQHMHEKDEAVRQEIVDLKQEQQQEIAALKQEQQESENKLITQLKKTEEEAQKKDETLRHEIAALKRRQEDAVSKEEGEAVKQEKVELRKRIAENEAVKQEVGKRQEETVLREDHETTKQELTQLKARQEEDRSSLQTLQSYTGPPIDLTMTKYEKHKRDGDEWYSEPFYTHPYGYKMCLNVNAKGKHVSVFCYLMRGKFDDRLRWPFQGHITVQLINHLEDKHYTATLDFSNADSDLANRVTTGERSLNGKGIVKFIPHNELQAGFDPAKNCQFLKDDCLHFRVIRVTNLNWTSLERQCLVMESRVCVPPFEFTMRDFEQQKTDNDIWYSPSFYTHPRGYRMCLRVHANGDDAAKGEHVSAFIHLMKGEWDNYLKWSFRGDITIQLLNQREDKEHCENICEFSDTVADNIAGRVTTKERAQEFGWLRFISHCALDHDKTKNCQYLMYNSLQFRIAKVELKN